MNFKEELNSKVAAIEEVLKAYMPKEEGPQKLIIEAMNYSIICSIVFMVCILVFML